MRQLKNSTKARQLCVRKLVYFIKGKLCLQKSSRTSCGMLSMLPYLATSRCRSRWNCGVAASWAWQ